MADRGSVNLAFLIGRLTKDPELSKVVRKNTYLARFVLATNEKFKSGNKKHTEYHYVAAWGSLAEFVGKYLKKGNLINLIGKIRYRYHNDETGKTRRIAEIEAKTITCLGRREDYEEEAEEPEVQEDDYKIEEPDPF